jgi:hypothetical protein
MEDRNLQKKKKVEFILISPKPCATSEKYANVLFLCIREECSINF